MRRLLSKYVAEVPQEISSWHPKYITADYTISAPAGTTRWYRFKRWVRQLFGRYTLEEMMLDSMAKEITAEVDKEILEKLRTLNI